MYRKIKNKIEYYIEKLKLNARLKREHDGDDINYYVFSDNKRKNIGSKNILIASHTLSMHIFGGQRSFLDMVEALYHGGYNIFVVLPRLVNNEYINLLSKYCVKIYIVQYGLWLKDEVNNNSVEKLKKIIQKNEIDIVYVNTIMCRAPLEAAQESGIKRVIHVRECIDKDEYLRKDIGLESVEILKKIQESADFLICNSLITSQMFTMINRDIVFNKININQFKHAHRKKSIDGEVIFGLISSNGLKKGIFDFLELAKELDI